MHRSSFVWRLAALPLICGWPAVGLSATEADPRLDLVTALEAVAPHASLGDRAKILGDLVGTWDVEYTDFLKDGSVKHASGEFIVGWVLDGRAIQDVWTIHPSEPGKERYIATTLRYVDAKTGAWHAIFVDPANDWVMTFTGVEESADRVVFHSQPVRGKEVRWSIIDIRPNSFVQREEESSDAGQTWRLTAEHRMKRRMTKASAASSQDNAYFSRAAP